MKEQGIELSKFVEGLRKYDNTGFNQVLLTECFNVIPRIQGLIPSPTISQPITSISADHPYPQIFIGHTHWVLCTEDKIYTINGDYSVTQVLDVAPYYGAFPSAPKGVWHFADFFDYVVLSNGGVTVIYSTINSQFEFNDGTIIPTIGTVCNFNGQILGSGVATVTGDAKTTFGETDAKSFMWGGIGYADFTVDQSNTRGYRPMPWYGQVYKVMQLGSDVIVYGSNGIARIRFTDSVPGIVKVHKYGIASRGAAGGDDDQHVFIDTMGNLRKITPEEFNGEPLYNEFFNAMLGNEVVVSHNSDQEEFYITDGVVSYCLTKIGLAEIAQAPTTLALIGGSLIGAYTDLNDSEARMTTDFIDFGVRGYKTIHSVEVSARCGSGETISVAIEYKTDYDEGETTTTTSWIEINPQGFAVIPVHGLEFKIKVKCSDYSEFKLDKVLVRVKFDDKRNVRGINVS